MPRMGLFSQLKLMQGETQLGTLTIYDMDWPWVNCHFESETAFEKVRHLFDAEQAILVHARTPSDYDAWERSYDDIEALGLRLFPEDWEPIVDFLLHIEGNEAWFRY
jgi:hypothetical protein